MSRSESKTDWELVVVVGLLSLPLVFLIIFVFMSQLQWAPLEWVGLVAVLAASALGMTGLLFWRRVRLAQADAAWKQGLLQRGLSAEEIERLIRGATASPPSLHTENQTIEDLAACLQRCGASEDVMEQVFRAVRTAEPPARLALWHAIQGLAGESGEEATNEQILATVRGLCGNQSAPFGGSPLPTGDGGGDALAPSRRDTQHIRAEPGAAADQPRE
jgi:hypothetical protein